MAAHATRWDHAPPIQARGRETQERIIEAVERLLETKSFEEISVQEIVEAADTNTGSFYARFASREALLPFLYARYHDEARAAVDEADVEARWVGLTFRETISRFVGLAVQLPKARPWRMRTVSLFARTHPEAIPEAAKARSRDAYKVVNRIMERHSASIRRSDRDRALAFITFVVITAARERMVFPDAPMASALPHDPDEFERELETLMFAYLTATEACSDTES